jgi:hypothetical protein
MAQGEERLGRMECPLVGGGADCTADPRRPQSDRDLAPKHVRKFLTFPSELTSVAPTPCYIGRDARLCSALDSQFFTATAQLVRCGILWCGARKFEGKKVSIPIAPVRL